jgi:chemotaxis protein MotA
MDPAAMIGVGLALVAIFGSMIIEGSSPMVIVVIPALMLVFIGTLGAAMAGGVLKDAKAIPKQLIRAMTGKVNPVDEMVATLIQLAERARREGLLALESEIAGLEPPFLRRGLQMAVDGVDPEEVAEILSSEVDTKRANDKRDAKLFADMGGYAPTIGIMLSANIFWLPLNNRLRRLSELECDQMEIAIEGILAIQAGSNPRLVAQKLQSLLPGDMAPREDDREVA